MFKVYQKVHNCVNNAYINAIDSITISYILSSIAVGTIFIFIFLFWIYNIPQEKIVLSKLYGHLLLVPLAVLKSNIRIANSLKDAL